MWIEKPSGGQHGVGMHVHQGCQKLRHKYGKCKPTDSRPLKFFIMEYIDPALLSGHKFDVRSYLVVVSLDPLLVFYHDGFVRRATRYVGVKSDVVVVYCIRACFLGYYLVYNRFFLKI